MKIIAIIISLLVIVGGAYLLLSPNKTQQQFNDNTNNEPVPASLDVSLNDQNNSGELGIATIAEENGKAVVTINVKGAPEKIEQPANIQMGSCSLAGDLKYPLRNVVDGVSVTTLDVNVETLKANLPLLINVRKSVAESSVYVTCGDINF